MSGPPSLIMLQFLTWVEDRPRTYAEAMEAWRSTCPRLSVWEDAIIEGLVQCEGGGRRAVTLTARGRTVLMADRHKEVAVLASTPRDRVF